MALPHRRDMEMTPEITPEITHDELLARITVRPDVFGGQRPGVGQKVRQQLQGGRVEVFACDRCAHP